MNNRSIIIIQKDCIYWDTERKKCTLYEWSGQLRACVGQFCDMKETKDEKDN